MPKQIYDSERAYRAYMINADIYQRGLTSMVSEVIAFALFIYLISTYSVPVAIALSICLIGYCAWKERKQTNKMVETIQYLEKDDSPFYS